MNIVTMTQLTALLLTLHFIFKEEETYFKSIKTNYEKRQ